MSSLQTEPAPNLTHQHSTASERWLRWLKVVLRLQAFALSTAIVFVFVPSEWMAETNRMLGLDPLPRQPLIEYLTRSLSLLYAMYGSISWITATDPRRYAGVITHMGCSVLAAAAILLGIDLAAGMPLWWAILEGLVPAAGGTLILTFQALSRRG